MATREIHRPLRHRCFTMSAAFRDTLHDVAVLVARRERHQGIETRWILAKRRLHDALMLDKRSPVVPSDVAQARDAIGHHELRQHEPLRRQGHGIFWRNTGIAHPSLEPHERG